MSDAQDDCPDGTGWERLGAVVGMRRFYVYCRGARLASGTLNCDDPRRRR
jgi:hypothetical protein